MNWGKSIDINSMVSFLRGNCDKSKIIYFHDNKQAKFVKTRQHRKGIYTYGKKLVERAIRKNLSGICPQIKCNEKQVILCL